MFLKKLQNFIAIIVTFMSLTFNLNSQISDNFLLLYESYDKLSQIEQIIEEAEPRILRKYGITEQSIFDRNLELQPTKHFIGYQVKKFNNLRLIELKFNKDSIEDFFIANSLPFFGFKGKVKVYLAANDSFFDNSNLFIFDNKDFQNELLNAKLLSELNQNIALDFEYLDNYPSDSFATNQLINDLSRDEKDEWVLMLVDRFDLGSWSYSFPRTQNILIARNYSFRSILLNETIDAVSKQSLDITKKTFIASFRADLSINDIESIFNNLSESTDILNFRVLNSNKETIDLEYESYLESEDAAALMSSLGASENS